MHTHLSRLTAVGGVLRDAPHCKSTAEPGRIVASSLEPKDHFQGWPLWLSGRKVTRFAFVVAFRCCSAFGDGVVNRDDLYIRVHPCFVYEDDRVLV